MEEIAGKAGRQQLKGRKKGSQGRKDNGRVVKTRSTCSPSLSFCEHWRANDSVEKEKEEKGGKDKDPDRENWGKKKSHSSCCEEVPFLGVPFEVSLTLFPPLRSPLRTNEASPKRVGLDRAPLPFSILKHSKAFFFFLLLPLLLKFFPHPLFIQFPFPFSLSPQPR